jgi:GGDEF domain-containing protein
LQNIENITLANWLDSKAGRGTSRPTYHFAIKQSEISIDFHIRQFFRGEEVSFHYFNDFQTLSKICLRYPVDMIVIAGKSLFLRELELMHAIRQNIVLSIVPVVAFHPSPPSDVIVAAYQNGVEDFIYGEWVEKLVEVRIKRVIDRSRRDLSVNPSTRLPGPAMIERELDRQISLGQEFAVCYADLDNFKAYNDYYGYAYGDQIIKMTGKIIKDIVYDLCQEAFVGHIAGDDFIYIIPRELIHPICGWVIKCFDSFIPHRYDPEDRKRGYIVTTNRRGVVERFSILTISIAVIINERGRFEHVGQLSKMLADLKKACKSTSGSTYMLERRKKY